MTETTAPAHSVPTRSRRSVRVVIIVGIAFLSFIVGVKTGDREVAGLKSTINVLQTQNRNLASETNDLRAKLDDAQAKRSSAQATLDAMVPSANRYEFGPNQSLIVAGGKLTIGLIGRPRSESVDLNINGKQYSATAGDVFSVTAEPSMTCLVSVMSFDVLKSNAAVNATCTDVKN